MSTPSHPDYYPQEYVASSGEQLLGTNQIDQSHHSNHPEQFHSLPTYDISQQKLKNYTFNEPNIYSLQQVYQTPSSDYYQGTELTSINASPSMLSNSVRPVSLNIQQGPSIVPSLQQLQQHPYGNSMYASTALGGTSNHIAPVRYHLHHHSNTSTVSSSSNPSQTKHLRTSSISNDFPEPVKPRIATTYWEDENTMCYQVKARGVLVSRREDTNFINGTKLLNVIGMTRGKRDGILKSEKTKTVVKVGSMNLKGVWIPFERAAEIARNEGVDNDELLGPLFVKDLKTYFNLKGYKLKIEETDQELENGHREQGNSFFESASVEYPLSKNNGNRLQAGVPTKPTSLLRQNYFDAKPSVNLGAKE
ncbi:uncharacterized protein PRCAT00005736001 [Priceomyces carsonii]|uniref:uncharacterized protein n=1 Tax=Priceomyces carsonii TaxID=28549 RepID=UPI002ED79B1E|nr:unnamed protein product [Priceomyces carsonii]